MTQPPLKPEQLTVAVAAENISKSFDHLVASGAVHRGLEQCLLFLAEKAQQANGIEDLTAENAFLKDEIERLNREIVSFQEEYKLLQKQKK